MTGCQSRAFAFGISKEVTAPSSTNAAATPPALRVRQTFHAQGLDAAGKLITDEVVDALTVAGTGDECRARLAQYREAGLQLPILFPVETNIRMAMEALCP